MTTLLIQDNFECHFVNLLSFVHKSYSLLSLRYITRSRSQVKQTRTHVDHPTGTGFRGKKLSWFDVMINLTNQFCVKSQCDRNFRLFYNPKSNRIDLHYIFLLKLIALISNILSKKRKFWVCYYLEADKKRPVQVCGQMFD